MAEQTRPRQHGEATPVRLEEITKRFGRVIAADRVSLEIPPGSLVTLLGPSGCGKTTTLRIIAGLEQPTSGRVFIGDEDVTPLPAANRSVTMVFQAYALFPHLSVFENVAYGLRVQRRPEAEVRRRVAEVLQLVGLPGLEGRQPGQLSGGQQQRVALARALIMEPRVLLFDEPLSNLDAKLRKRVRADIRVLQQELGITSVYVTHDQSEALAISDTVVVMNQGRIEQIGTPTDLYRRPASRFVADFIGEANLLPATVEDGMVRVGDYRFAYRQPGIPAGAATLMARPEAIRVATDGEGLAGRIRTAFFMGTYADYLIDTDVGEVSVADARSVDRMLAVGQPVKLEFLPSGLYLLPAS
ncbi:MAG: ABC transporter ATP-binding protein [Armatimonadota bacterium]|nr:ABC transporter ATP-binding protein [Armatimonadota bacterium]